MIIPLRVPSPMFFGGLDHPFFYLSLWMKSFGVTIEMNSSLVSSTIAWYYLLSIVLTFDCLDETLWCDYRYFHLVHLWSISY